MLVYNNTLIETESTKKAVAVELLIRIHFTEHVRNGAAVSPCVGRISSKQIHAVLDTDDNTSWQTDGCSFLMIPRVGFGRYFDRPLKARVHQNGFGSGK